MVNKKVLIGLILLASVVAAAFFFALNSKKGPGQETRELTQSELASLEEKGRTSSQVPSLESNSLDIKKRLTATDQKVGDLRLEGNENFKIDYLISNDEFYVAILKPGFKGFKQEAINWFLEKGFKQEDLCVLKINFAVNKEIAESENLNIGDLTVEGCQTFQ